MSVFDPFSLQNKAAVVTGGASGIGLGQSLRFLEAGASVAVLDIKSPPQEALARGLRYIPCDISIRENVELAFEQVSSMLGPLSIVSHNAGRPGKGIHITDSDEQVLDAVVALNLYGTYYVLKFAPKYMCDGGSIITTASVAGLQQNEGFFDYSATKAATISLTKTAAVELGSRGIRCNVVAPGPVRTPMLPPGHILNTLARELSTLGRIAEVDDLVGVYHFLASDQSKYVTGHTLVVDGGRLTGFRNKVLAKLAG